MADERSDASFAESWQRLFREQGWTQSRVAATIGIDPSFFSKALREADYKKLSADWIAAIAAMAGLPDDYYPEVREDVVLDAIRSDPALRDRLYDELRPRRDG